LPWCMPFGTVVKVARGAGAKPRGPSEVTLAGVPLIARPPNPGEVTEAGVPLI